MKNIKKYILISMAVIAVGTGIAMAKPSHKQNDSESAAAAESAGTADTDNSGNKYEPLYTAEPSAFPDASASPSVSPEASADSMTDAQKLEEYQKWADSMEAEEKENGDVMIDNPLPEENVWTQGNGTEKKEDKTFNIIDYDFSPSKLYQAAYDYADSSSEQYKIVPVMAGNQLSGYKVVFKK